MKVKIYGSRGSVPFFSRSNIKYGGNTVCTVLDIDGQIVLLDCGSALMQFYYDYKDKLKDGLKFDILLSHLHLDHIIGFSTFGPILSPDCDISIYTRSRSDQPLPAQVFGIFKPPYWPVDIAEKTHAKVIEIADVQPFMLSEKIKVTPFWSEHHNETSAFRIDADKTLIYLLDYEINANSDKYEELIEFCRDAELVIFDATYLPEDYPPRRGWGHSTFEDGIALAKAASCKRMVFSHICHDYTDAELDSARFRFDNVKYSLAYDGMEMEI